MRFAKDLGPTAQKVAQRKLQPQDLINQAHHQPEPLFQSPDALRPPHILDLNSINESFKNTITQKVNQPLLSFGNSNASAIANNEGKNIMVDDGKSKHNKWDLVNLELLLGKQKGGVKIGSGSFDNKDFGNKNLDNAQVGNQRTINQIGSFWSNYNGNILNQNVNKISGLEHVTAQKEVSWNASNVMPNATVYPSTNMLRPANNSNSYLGSDGEVGPYSWVLQPPMHSPTLQNQESNARSQNLWAPRQTTPFQAYPHGPIRQRPPDIWYHMGMSGANPEQHA